MKICPPVHSAAPRGHRCVPFGLLILTAAAGPGDLSGQSLADLGFMSGCWQGSFGSGDRRGTIEERYTSPSENVILGTTRYLREGRAVQFEFTLLRADEGGIAMTPYPGGNRSEHAFVLTGVQNRRAVFEAPEHDFPKRIIYDGSLAGRLTATIDAGAGSDQRQSWQMRSVSCDSSP